MNAWQTRHDDFAAIGPHGRMMVLMQSPITPPGWYDDGHGQQRWWDGAQWTDRTAPLSATAPAPVPATAAATITRVSVAPLAWTLAVVMVLAAALGAAGAAVLWTAIDTAPQALHRTYADFTAAERARDCDAITEVTTPSFRDALFDGDTCEQWAARPAAQRQGEPRWGLKVGPVGVLVVEERFPGDRSLDGSPSGATFHTYLLVRQGGQWRLDGRDQS